MVNRSSSERAVNILGTRGIPASHGGFETFVARLAPYLCDRGWIVNVYCQGEVVNGTPPVIHEDSWEGITRTIVTPRKRGSAGSIEFDWKCIGHVAEKNGVDLVLGYNTAVFSLLQKLRGRIVIVNMDGIEWKRQKWGLTAKAWFYANELIANHFSSIPIADHPEIAKHLSRHGHGRAVVIPYGADKISCSEIELLSEFGVRAEEYFITICRIEPENSILEIVESFSLKPRPYKLLVLGTFDEKNRYHQKVRAAASGDVLFPGAIYEPAKVSALRFFARAYVHGHQVGGTNPSLVEALGAGNAIIAHANSFNRWVAGEHQLYFKDIAELLQCFESMENDEMLRQAAKMASSERHAEAFTWEKILGAYEKLLEEAYSRCA